MENKIIYPKLSYKILGVMFKIHRELGSEYQERYYQRAAALAFDQENIKSVNYEMRFLKQKYAGRLEHLLQS